MEALQVWAVENLGPWIIDYSALILIIAAALLLILLLTFIIVACRHAHNVKKFRKLNAELAAARANSGESSNVDEAALRAEIRAEVEAELRAENSGVSDAQVDDLLRKIDDLTADNNAKQRRIDELSAIAAASSGDVSSEQLQSQIEAVTAKKNEEALELRIKISELKETNKDLENEINLLKAENAQIKAQALQQQLAQQKEPAAARTSTRSSAANTAKAEPAAKPAAKTAAKAQKVVEPEPDEEDEYDEYYDDYGDENSAVKVTLKFDRTKQNWVILRTDTDRAYRRLATKQEALPIAKDLARRLHAQLVVHKKDGKFQKI